MFPDLQLELTKNRLQVPQPGRRILFAVLDFGRRLFQIDVGLFGKHLALERVP